jgi:hypothetical protein
LFFEILNKVNEIKPRKMKMERGKDTSALNSSPEMAAKSPERSTKMAVAGDGSDWTLQILVKAVTSNKKMESERERDEMKNLELNENYSKIDLSSFLCVVEGFY